MTKAIAHRGYRVNNEPENSIPAFKTAINNQCDGIEFDVHLTADKQFICFHDYDLLQLGKKEYIKDLSYKELTNIELDSNGVTIPGLDQILELFGNKTLLNIEIKTPRGCARELNDILTQFSIQLIPDNVIISSFHHVILQEIKNINKSIPTALLCHSPFNQLKVASKLACDAIHPFYDIIPNNWKILHSRVLTIYLHKFGAHRLFKLAEKEGILINIYMEEGNIAYIKSAIEKQVNGIITDNPEQVVKHRI
ncbi:MAG: glycerophosphodiester phosphodiesterase [Candidatus Heimdallarchaeota archaeon]|nr:glycerophosphodiester phosphodiesterase [Candidatus Heimdallarchaeota archaeon]